MFQHSVKVPRLYKVAAAVAKEADEGLGSIKQLVYDKKKKHPNIKAVYALVATLFQRKLDIDNLLKRSQFLTKEPKSDPWLIKILIVELVWGKKRLPGQSRPENTVRAYEQIFKAHLSDSSTVEEHNTKGNLKPRYVRVNTLRMTMNEAVEGFRDEGWVLSKCLDKNDYQEFLKKVTSLGDDEFLIDIHIPNLLIFPPKTQFYNHPAYKNGSIILQDKASCLPVHILSPPPGSTVLDMCAAPGMKTTHLAAVLDNNGTVYAVERDPKRFETLNRIIDSSGAKCVKTSNKDVLTCNATDFPGVEYILVDPSCSGSGMTDRLAAREGESSRNFDKLTGFQILILRSALRRYPDVKRVVYSTCSVYPEENEDVVRQVLETNYNFKLVDAKQYVNNTWQNFGSSDFGDIGKHCLYAKPNEDHTNGFFVAVFERLADGENNEFFNTKIFNFQKHINAKERRYDDRKTKLGRGDGIKNDPKTVLVDCDTKGQNIVQDFMEEPGRYKTKNGHGQKYIGDAFEEATTTEFDKENIQRDNIADNFDKIEIQNMMNQSISGKELTEEGFSGVGIQMKKHRKKKMEIDKEIYSNNTDDARTLKKISEIGKNVVIQDKSEEKKVSKKKKQSEILTEEPIIQSLKETKRRKKNTSKINSTNVEVISDSVELNQQEFERKKKSKKKRSEGTNFDHPVVVVFKDEENIRKKKKQSVLEELTRKKKKRSSRTTTENIEDISVDNDELNKLNFERKKKSEKKERERTNFDDPMVVVIKDEGAKQNIRLKEKHSVLDYQEPIIESLEEPTRKNKKGSSRINTENVYISGNSDELNLEHKDKSKKKKKQGTNCDDPVVCVIVDEGEDKINKKNKQSEINAQVSIIQEQPMRKKKKASKINSEKVEVIDIDNNDLNEQIDWKATDNKIHTSNTVGGRTSTLRKKSEESANFNDPGVIVIKDESKHKKISKKKKQSQEPTIQLLEEPTRKKKKRTSGINTGNVEVISVDNDDLNEQIETKKIDNKLGTLKISEEGANFKDAVVVVDEAEKMSKKEEQKKIGAQELIEKPKSKKRKFKINTGNAEVINVDNDGFIEEKNKSKKKRSKTVLTV